MNYALFRKPARYIGHEVNSIRKEAPVQVALCFPDTYEIGMSHLGLKILYAIINSLPEASAERVFAPWVDMEPVLRENDSPLLSLENQRPLKEFDIAGFTLQYELSYTNVLNMLDLGGIPVRSEQRDNRHPVIIAGGPCTVNPLPLSPFIDAFVIGDGEDVTVEITERYAKLNNEDQSAERRKNILASLAEVDGVYVPAIHAPGSHVVRRRVVGDLDNAPFPEAPVLPYMKAVHDRVAIEISRGCTRGCRFCQAGMIYRPLRERSPEKILSLGKDALDATGYEEISFTSLSTGDYSSLLPLIQQFNRMCSGSSTSVSLPSLRVGSVNSDILKEIKSVRKTGFTIAPEAGTQRLRNVINKDFSDEEYEATLKKLFTEGWTTIKLYFMIGLPTETMEDIDGLIDMAVKALKTGRQIARRRVTVNVGISAFVPKPLTPFQWQGQAPSQDLRQKQDYIKRAFKKCGISFKGQHVENSLLEAVFSRGDAESARLLEEAWKLGCRFDGWTEHFSFEKWQKAAELAGIDLSQYASRSYTPDDPLPWDFIDTGITKRFFQSEYEKSLQGVISPDCRNACTACGLDCSSTGKAGAGQEPPSDSRNRMHTLPGAGSAGNQPQTKYRAAFSKTGILRFLSHHELMTALIRAMKRARVPLAYSTGFHPHPKVSFGPALSVGISGLNEFFDVELKHYTNASEMMNRINRTLPEGLSLHAVTPLPVHAKALNSGITEYEYEVTIGNSAHQAVQSFLQLDSCPVRREKKTVDIRPVVVSADIDRDRLRLVLRETGSASVRLLEILKELLQKPVEEILTYDITRISMSGYNSTQKKAVCRR